jgi:hypothetical protein
MTCIEFTIWVLFCVHSPAMPSIQLSFWRNVCMSRFNYYVVFKENFAAMSSIVSSLPDMGLLASFSRSVHTTCLQLYFNYRCVSGNGIYIVWGWCCIACRMLTSDIHRNHFEWLCLLIVSLSLFWYVDAAKEVRKQLALSWQQRINISKLAPLRNECGSKFNFVGNLCFKRYLRFSRRWGFRLCSVYVGYDIM